MATAGQNVGRFFKSIVNGAAAVGTGTGKFFTDIGNGYTNAEKLAKEADAAKKAKIAARRAARKETVKNVRTAA